jgi:hypothetical protein
MSSSETFDIINYMSGLTNYTFDKAVLERIALDRGVRGVTEYATLTQKDKDLLKADLYYEAYYSPTLSSSVSQSHGAFSKVIGSQQISASDKEKLFKAFSSIYKKYNDPKIEEQSELFSNLQWLE